MTHYLYSKISSVFGTHDRIRTPCVIIWKPYMVYITLYKLYIIDESIRKMSSTLFIINFMKILF